MAIYRLIRNYYADRKVDRPVSIATFGPPAGNRSRLSPSLRQSIPLQHDHLLSSTSPQFTDTRDLTAAFHQAQDRAIAGVLPLVIFDEFDCSFQKQKLGWLAQFLAPMQTTYSRTIRGCTDWWRHCFIRFRGEKAGSRHFVILTTIKNSVTRRDPTRQPASWLSECRNN